MGKHVLPNWGKGQDNFGFQSVQICKHQNFGKKSVTTLGPKKLGERAIFFFIL